VLELCHPTSPVCVCVCVCAWSANPEKQHSWICSIFFFTADSMLHQHIKDISNLALQWTFRQFENIFLFSLSKWFQGNAYWKNGYSESTCIMHKCNYCNLIVYVLQGNRVNIIQYIKLEKRFTVVRKMLSLYNLKQIFHVIQSTLIKYLLYLEWIRFKENQKIKIFKR